jgi:2-polyprenyl-6-methoxyphenol hydroxylase-like FAD-dependent oxidoreductase
MKVLIMGGGIGGFSAAIALRRAGFEVEIHERPQELAEVGSVLSLRRYALAALDRLDLLATGGIRSDSRGAA